MRWQAIRSELTNDERQCLLSFEAGDPEWDRFPLAGIVDLPAPQFKLLNIQKFRQDHPERHATLLEARRSIRPTGRAIRPFIPSL
jgi:hypothetical protein